MSDAINWHPNGTPGPWNQMFHDLTVRTSNRACKYPASNICTVIAACKPERTAIINARAIAEVPAMVAALRKLETTTAQNPIADEIRAIFARIDGGV
jgi:hypothetical protein